MNIHTYTPYKHMYIYTYAYMHIPYMNIHIYIKQNIYLTKFAVPGMRKRTVRASQTM